MTLIPHDIDEPVSTTTADPPPRLLPAGKARGIKVINQQDETLGEIDDVVFDVQGGSVAYAAMASGGFLGLGERLFAVPWTALAYDASRQCFVLNAQKESFEHAPGFDKDRWPSDAGAEWHEQVHRHYGRSPYWQHADSTTGARP
jgi:PRC-barrel domain